MSNNKQLTKAAITGVLALGLVAGTSSLLADDEMGLSADTEKCSGIVKKGMNDCGANGHACGGMSKEDNEAGEWIKVPKGTCEKIVGGVVVE